MQLEGGLTSWNDERGFGWPGALPAQQFLRHKSVKPAIRQVFGATVVFNVLASSGSFGRSVAG